MVASVQMSIDLIGGHSLNGPINRLQNAVSYNYYANTEIYDPRSDTIKNGEIIDGLKLGEERAEGLGPDGLKSFLDSLKEEAVTDQLEDSETGDDADGNGDNVLLIEKSGTDGIIIKTKDDKPPAEQVIGKEPNPSNKIDYKVKIGSESDEGTTEEKDYETNIKKVNSTDEVVDPTELNTLDTALKASEDALSAAKINFKNFKTKANKDAHDAARGKVKQDEKNKKDYLKGKVDKVKVVAFLSENKSKTKVTKTFTITKDGLT
jgi:hypothetical protein